MYQLPRQEPTHESVASVLQADTVPSRTDKFFQAAATGDTETLLRYIQHIPDCTSWKDKDGGMVIHQAVINKHKDVCNFLFKENGVLNVDALDKNGRAPIRYAAANEDEELVKILLTNGAKPDITSPAGNTVLAFAASNGYTPICRTLLVEGKADPNYTNNNGVAPLGHASGNGHGDTCKLLLEFGADPSHSADLNATALHTASRKNQATVCQILMNAKADPNRQLVAANSNEDGYTPLHIAASSGHLETCKVLLNGGSNPDIKAQNGYIPLATATKHKDVFKLLLEYKSDIHWTGNRGRTLLHYACEHEDVELCMLLLKANLDANIQDEMGITALHIACMNRRPLFTTGPSFPNGGDRSAGDGYEQMRNVYVNVMHADNERTGLILNSGTVPKQQDKTNLMSRMRKLLLDNNAEPNLRDYLGKTALHYVVVSRYARYEGSQLLIDHGGDPTIADENGNTPLHAAVKQQSDDINLHILLVERGGDPYVINRHRQTAKQLSSWGRDEDFLIAKAIQRRQYTNLLSGSDTPLQVVKLFFCGDPKAGKTTLKKSLTEHSFLRLPGVVSRTIQRLRLTSSSENNDEYISTPGIDVATEKISEAGLFSTWDCAGQIEFHITHGMFMGVENSIFTVTYDLSKDTISTWKCVKYWLSFIRAGHNPRQKIKSSVVLVASHLDKCNDKQKAIRNAEELLKQSKRTFCYYLNISSELVVLDARLPTGVGMTSLKRILQQASTEIKGTKTIPALCEKIKTMKDCWGRDDYPVLSWSEYYQTVKDMIDPLVKEDTLKLATSYLHDMGEIYFAELTDREHQVILKTNWFCYVIIGAAFARDDFPADFEKLPQRRVYTRNQLKDFFKTSADVDLLISLLQHVGLLHKCGGHKYIIPGKLPDTHDKVSWRREDEFKEYYGRRLQCEQHVDMFAPDVFPCIQTRVMEEFDMIDEPATISRTTLKFSHGSVEGMLQFGQDKRAINIACRCRGDEDRGECHDTLIRVTRLVQLELLKRSPGTHIKMLYLSPRALLSHDDLEDVWYYSEEDLQKGEIEGRNIVKYHSTGNTEKISAILCLGYDSLFLQCFGAVCSTQWVPRKVKKELYLCLDDKSTRRDDYRSLAEVLGVPRSELREIERSSTASITQAIITGYCDREDKPMSLGILYNILSHPGLVDNANALKILDDLFSEMGIEVCGMSGIESEIPIDHIAWRATLRHCWEALRADIIPNSLLHPFLSEDDEELIQAEERNHGTRKATDLLLECLLQQRGWYADFLKSLEYAGFAHLTQMLTDTHRQVFDALPIVHIARQKYLLAWNRVMTSKWRVFRSTLVPHTILPNLPFLSEEDKEDILDLEIQLSLPSAADIIHTKVRDTNDPTHYAELIACLRNSGFADLATTLCDQLKTVLLDDEFRYLAAHFDSLYPL